METSGLAGAADQLPARQMPTTPGRPSSSSGALGGHEGHEGEVAAFFKGAVQTQLDGITRGISLLKAAQESIREVAEVRGVAAAGGEATYAGRAGRAGRTGSSPGTPDGTQEGYGALDGED